jgi:hypothetical protein
MRIIGSCLVALAAASAVVAASASAALPELGRCEKVEPVKEGKKLVYHGGYQNDGCTKISKAKKGKYGWTPGPGAADTFYDPGAGGEQVFETVDGSKLICSSIAVKGEYTGPKTEKITSLALEDCENGTHKLCQTSPEYMGEIKTEGTIVGELGPIAVTKKGHKKLSAGWALKPESEDEPIFFSYYCGNEGEVPQAAVLEGSVIGVVAAGASSNLDRMNTESLIDFKAHEGVQLPEAFEGGAKDTLSTRAVSSGVESSEQTGLSGVQEAVSGPGEAGETSADKEPLEIKLLPEEAPIT